MTDLRYHERRPRRPLWDEEEREDIYEEEEEEETSRAPLAYRVVAWASVVVLLFAAGYWGTSFVLKLLNRNQIIEQEDVARTTEDAQRIEADQSSDPGIAGRRSGFEIFVPKGETLATQSVSHVPGLLEDDAKAVITSLLETMRAENTISEHVRVLHVFRNGDLLYLDLNDPFTSALQKLSGPRANLVMTSLVRTIVHNFSPVTRVRLLVNGKDSDMKTPVDLTMPWQLKTSS